MDGFSLADGYCPELSAAALTGLDDRRRGHVLRTAALAAELIPRVEEDFRRLGAPPEEPPPVPVTSVARVRLAGIIHDCRKLENGTIPDFPPDALEARHPDRLLHGALAAQWAYDRGLRDGAVLFAVRYHTIGHPRPTPLLAALMTADAAEPGRAYPGVEELRRAMTANPLSALRLRLVQTTDYVLARGFEVHPHAVAMLAWLDSALPRLGEPTPDPLPPADWK